MYRAQISVDREQIGAMEGLIRPHIRRTPVVEVNAADFGLSCANTVSFKLESLQRAGSFKVRGAFANLLSRRFSDAGVVAASGGNHGVAVAFAAQRFDVPAKIFVPSIASKTKIARIREFDAALTVAGDRYADALAASEAWVAATGAMPVHAFDSVETLLGQGTLGMELSQQVPDLDTILIAVGGGGLIGGVAAWYADRVRIVGVEPEAAPTLTNALKAGRPVDTAAGGIAADSLAPRRVGELMFPIAACHVDSVILVSDDEIRDAQTALWKALRIVSEPGGAAAFAALLSGRYRPSRGEKIGVLICGANIDITDFRQS